MNPRRTSLLVLTTAAALLAGSAVSAAEKPPGAPRTSYMNVVPQEEFSATLRRMKSAKPELTAGHRTFLVQRYDLADGPLGVSMFRGKPVQGGVRVLLPSGVTWDQLAALSPEEIRARKLFPAGFYPLPHPNHAEGGMLFPKFQIDEVRRQEGRDLTRFDLDFDLPDHFLPEFPPAIFLTTRPDLGDVSRGRLVTLMNFHELFDGLLNPKQLDGLRLLLTPFPQQQFNLTDDRRSELPSRGVACLDCHANGHTNGSTHLAGDVRPQEHRHRLDTPSLRGVNIQRLFGSQRALKTVEDFTEFEQRAAYFDGDPVVATKKGLNILDRGSQVHDMSEFQELLDFPPAPKLDLFGRLRADRTTESERRGETLFFGKARCAECHPPPYYTDNTTHNLQVERFFEPTTIRGRTASADGPIKTFPLRGIKESPPYLHDGRLLTLADTVEFFNLVLGVRLTEPEKRDLTTFLLAL